MIKATVDPSKVSQPQFGMIVERDVDVPMRDGLALKCDIFRPDDGGKFPIVMTLGPYPKDEPMDPAWLNRLEESGPYLHWETVNPEWWVPRGYVEIRVDMRGSGHSTGFCEILCRQEDEDFYDAIEWAAKQPWSNGNVGLLGISYFAVNQWKVSTMKPPSLKAMIPWEAWGDLYRDAAHHGGVGNNAWFHQWFWNGLMKRTLGDDMDGWRERFFDFRAYLAANPLDNAFYEDRGVRGAEWDQVETPFMSVGNWGGAGLHLRGNTESITVAGAKDKWLRMHTGDHIGPFYRLEARLDQIHFFDYWLKGMDNGLLQEPRIKLAIRTTAEEEEWRFEDEWPIARTQWSKMYLGEGGKLAGKAAAKGSSVTYSAEGPRDFDFRGVMFSTEPFAEDTEITGPLNLVMWVSSTWQDADLFAVVRNIAPDGSEVCFPNGQGHPSPCARGWLRVSHRKLDDEKSLPYRPYHSHDEVWPLAPDEVVQVEVEIPPMCNVYKKGHRLRLDIQPWDDIPGTRYAHDNEDHCRGQNTIYMGADRASYLLVPVIPPKG
jgi:predicted acyl esterase